MHDSFEKIPSFNNNERNWQKSVNEYAMFIVNHLDSQDFLDFLDDKEVDKFKKDRWQTRMDELFDKAVKRMGYRIDGEDLKKEAFDYIYKQKEAGEIPPSNFLENFCKRFED